MLFTVALRSAWHHKRRMGVILVVSWLVAGFCAYIPLFLDAFSEAVSREIVDGIRPEMTTLTLNNPRPFAPDSLTAVDREIGGMITGQIAFSRAVGSPDFPQLGKICGYDYARGELLTARSRYAVTTTDHCYKLYSFARPSDLFRLVDGRWPEALDSELPAPPLKMDAPQLEAAVTLDIAQGAGYAIGDYLVVGDDPTQALVVQIVGLLEPALPAEDIFWHGHTVVQAGEWTTYGDDMRFDVGLIVPSDAFEQWILPRYPANVYFHWWLRTAPQAINSDNLSTLNTRLYRIERDLRAAHPQLEMVSGLKAITAQYAEDIDRFERPVAVLAGMVLVLMAYQFLMIVRLALDETSSEQAVFTGRGASVGQRVVTRIAVGGLAVITSVGMGPCLALAAWQIFHHIGPLAVLSEDYSPSLANALEGALIGAGSLGLLLVGVIWFAARFPDTRSWLVGPDKPRWRRYFVDLLLIAAGFAFLLRLNFSTTGDLRQSIEALWRSPAALADPTLSGGLGDPFNATGPALILVGSALLWLRIYSWIVRLAGPAFRRQKGLAIPMAAWQTGRRVGPYAPLVVMLMGAMALGVASLVLDSTYDRQAWQEARQETGADVRLEYEQIETDWETLPGVNDSVSLMRLPASGQIVLMGIDPEYAFPGLQEAAERLAGHPSILPGWTLPDDTAMLQLQINTPLDPYNTTTTRLDAQVIDGRGATFTLEMSATEPAIPGRFIPYSVTLPAGPLPWRLTGFRLHSEREGTTMFSHTIFLDDLAVVNTQGTSTVLEDFERVDSAQPWASAASQSATAVVAVRNTEQASSGTASLSVEYRIRYAEIREFHPLLMVSEVAFPEVPLVISETFADWQKRQSGTEQNLAVGDRGRFQFELGASRYQLAYRVVAIVDTFPSMSLTDRLVVAPLEDLRAALNAQNKTNRYYDANQIWLALDSARPGAQFRRSASNLAGEASVTYAWDRYNDLRREPAIKAVTGILFAAFWFVWGLYAVYLGAHLSGSQWDHKRHILSVLGLGTARWRRLVAVEQVTLLIPTLAFSILASMMLTSWLLPFLAVMESDKLVLSPVSIGWMLFVMFLMIAPVAALGLVRNKPER